MAIVEGAASETLGLTGGALPLNITIGAAEETLAAIGDGTGQAPGLFFDVSGAAATPATGVASVDGSVGALVVLGAEVGPLAGTISTPANQFQVRGATDAVGAGVPTVISLAAQPVTLTIGNVNRTAMVSLESVTISEAINGRGSFRFSLVDEAASYRPSIGEEVRFWVNGNLEFAGTVQEVIEGLHADSKPATPVAFPQVVCVDYAAILDRRIVVIAFDEFTTAKAMMRAFVEKYLKDDGITFSEFFGDPGLIDQRLFSGKTVADAAQDVARATGWEWRVTKYKVFEFFNPASGVAAAPFSLSDLDGRIKVGSLSVRDFRGTYRNVQHVRASIPTGALFNEFAAGIRPGTVFDFETTQPIGEDQNIRVDIIGQFYTLEQAIVITQEEYEARLAANPWNSGLWHVKYTPGDNLLELNQHNEIFHSINGTPPFIGKVLALKVSYAVSGEATNLIVTEENTLEIDARKAIEGGSGRYEHIEEVNDIESEAAARDLAIGLLARYSVMPKELNFATHLAGLEPGQQITSTITKPPATGTFMIESVSKANEGDSLAINAKHPGTNAPWLLTRVKAVSGAMSDNAFEVRRRLLARDKPSRPREAHRYNWTLAETIQGLTNPGADSYTLPFTHPLVHEISQKGPFTHVSINVNGGPTGSLEGDRVKVDIEKNTLDDPDTFVSMTNGTGLVYPKNLNRSTVVGANLNVTAKAGEMVRLILYEAQSDTPITDIVVTALQFV